MKKENLRYMINLIIIIVVLFACCVGFALLLKNKANDGQDPVREIDVTMVSEKNNITIKSILSVSNEFGKSITEENNGAFGYLTFDVVNNTDYDRGFEIYVTENTSSEKVINGSYIIYYLTDFTDKPVTGFTENKLPSYRNLKVLSDKADSRLLYSSMIQAGGKKQFILRTWIDDLYVIQNDNEEFSFDVRVRAV